METQISNNSIQNPYKEFEVTIPAFGIVPVFYAFDYIRYLDFGGAGRGDILARIGSSGNESDVVGGGIGYKLTTAVDRIEFRNTTANPITIIIALAIGAINDDRLNFTGEVQVVNPIGEELNVKDADVLTAINNQKDYVPLGTNRRIFQPVGLTALALITPAENTNGVIITSLNGFSAAGSALAIYIDTAPPISWSDATKFKFCAYEISFPYNLQYPISIEAGKGVWVIASSSVVNNYAGISWRSL